MEACGVTPSIPISTTITQPFQKTCPKWWMIKTRVKSPALLHRLMIALPAIAHGRSDGFITAATESTKKECISWAFWLKHMHAKSTAVTFFLRLFHCQSVRPLSHDGILLSTARARLIRAVPCQMPPPSPV